MPYDLFLQAFEDGDAADRDLRRLFVGLDVRRRGSDAYRLVTEDGEADVYGLDAADGSLLVNHASGRTIWDLLHRVAERGGLAIMPVGVGTVLPDAALAAHLPEGAPEPIVVIGSGAELLAAIQDAG